MSNIDKYDYIGKIISYLHASEYVATIKQMSFDLNMPLPYVRRSMLSILKNNILSIDSDYDDDDVLDELLDEPDKFANLMLTGKYDNITWSTDLDLSDTNADVILPLSQIENSTLAANTGELNIIKHSALFERKSLTNPISPKVRQLQSTIQDAIEDGNAISFTYITGKGEELSVKDLPLRIITDVTDNWIYLKCAVNPYPIRLDRIKHFRGVMPNDGSYPMPEDNPKEKYYWGAAGDPNEEPTHVKLRIAAETRNIISKIKSDISFRSETGKFYQDGNFYYYEDDIIGMEKFRRWIRGYGSSIIVLEPESLKNEIVMWAKQTLDLYKASESWGDL